MSKKSENKTVKIGGKYVKLQKISAMQSNATIAPVTLKKAPRDATESSEKGAV